MYLKYENDITGNLQKVRGSDNRLNTSSRSATRQYYASRTNSAAFSASWDSDNIAAGQYVIYIKNTDTQRSMVVRSCDAFSENNSSFKLSLVSGDASGSESNLICLNRSAVKPGLSDVFVANSGTGVQTIQEEEVVSHSGALAFSAAKLKKEGLIIGQNEAFAIEYEQGTTGRTWGTVELYFEG